VDYNCLIGTTRTHDGSVSLKDVYGGHNFRSLQLFASLDRFNFAVAGENLLTDAGAPDVGAYFGKAPDVGLHETGSGDIHGQPVRPDAPEPGPAKP
jgi:hypothetical protein